MIPWAWGGRAVCPLCGHQDPLTCVWRWWPCSTMWWNNSSVVERQPRTKTPIDWISRPKMTRLDPLHPLGAWTTLNQQKAIKVNHLPEERHFGLCRVLSYFMSCLFSFQCALFVWLEVWMLFLCFDEVRRSWIYLWGWMKYLLAWIESPACQWNHMLSVGSVASTFKGI